MTLLPLERIVITDGGSTRPPIESTTVLIVVQSGKVLGLGRWLPTDTGGELTPPVDEESFVKMAAKRLLAEAPELLDVADSALLACWPDLEGQMRFVE